MSESNFRKLEVWQKARVLAREVYRETRCFPKVEVFGLVQQMRRAALSVLCNIAEGQGRRSRADKRHFTLVARGSLYELEAQVVISVDLEYMDEATGERLNTKAMEVTRLLNGLIRYYDRE